MPRHPLYAVLHHVRRLAHAPAPDALSDSQLLQRFAHAREEASFQTLIERHGPMVLGLCRRLLSDPHDAEDAFQATFLVMIRKAESLDMWGSLASWLYGVAYRTALKARSEAARRRLHERRAAESAPTSAAESEAAAPELQQVLDQELGQLPEKYRAPLMLCYLEGKTNEEAARMLGWPAGSMSRRLAKGRELLRRRLVRRGVRLSGAAIATAVAESAAPAAMPAVLRQATLQAATLLVAGQAPAATPATMLMEGVVRQMASSKMRSVIGLLLLVCLVGTGAAVVKDRLWPDQAGTAKSPGGDDKARELFDRLGDPLPPGAVARLGTGRLWQKEKPDSLTFSPDGRSLLTRSGTAKNGGGIIPARVWDVATGRQRPQLEGLRTIGNIGSPLYSYFVFSHDGKTLATITATPGEDGDVAGTQAIVFWNPDTGKQFRSLKINDTDSSLAFSPDGKTLAVGRGNGQIGIIDVATGQCRRELGSPTRDPPGTFQEVEGAGEYRRLRFSPDGRLLVSQIWDGWGLYEVATGKQLRRWEGPRSGFAFSADGSLWYAQWDEKEEKQIVICEEATTGRVIRQVRFDQPGREIPGGPNIVSLWSSHGKTVATEAMNEGLILWDLATGKERRLTPYPPPAAVPSWQEGGGPSFAFAFSEDGKLLATAAGHEIFLWDANTGRQLPQSWNACLERRGIVTAGFLPDGTAVAVVNHPGPALANLSLGLWDVVAAKELWRCDKPEFKWYVEALFSPDGKTLVVNEGGIHHLLDAKTGRSSGTGRPGFLQYLGAFSPDGQTLITCEDTQIAYVDVATGSRLRLVDAIDASDKPNNWIGGVAFSPDGTVLATSMILFHGIRLWNPATGELLREIEGGATDLAFSPDGEVLAVRNKPWLGPPVEPTLILYEAATAKERRRFRAGEPSSVIPRYHGRSLRDLAWSPDGRFLAMGQDDGSVRLWEAATGKEYGRFRGHQAAVYAVAFSPDGKRLLSVSNDRTALVWDVAQGLRTER
jgi:RNA polymerase sigma factor (sigma-70 family)